MKKLFMAVAMAFISVAGFAQSGSWSVGLNFGYGTDISKPFLGGRVTEVSTIISKINTM